MEDISTAPTATSADAIKALMLLRAEMVQRETRMSAAITEQVHSLRQEVGQFRRDIAALVEGAVSRIADDARDAVFPVTAQYSQAISATSARLHGAGRVVWIWFGAAMVILMLVLFVAWTVLGYYRRELTTTKEEPQRYEDAVPVVQAFYASDAMIFGGVICTNVDPGRSRTGEKGQYRAARQRSQR